MDLGLWLLNPHYRLRRLNRLVFAYTQEIYLTCQALIAHVRCWSQLALKSSAASLRRELLATGNGTRIILIILRNSIPLADSNLKFFGKSKTPLELQVIAHKSHFIQYLYLLFHRHHCFLIVGGVGRKSVGGGE